MLQGNRDARLQCGEPARAISPLKCWNHDTPLQQVGEISVKLFKF